MVIPTQTEHERVAELLGRPPSGKFEIVVRDNSGDPIVIRNYPVLENGKPMPTLYWLVSEELRSRIGTLESQGGVKKAEAEVDSEELIQAHLRYAKERDSVLPDSYQGHRPSAGVGGTRQGVKCLHAHYAWFLAGGDDPVGRWVHNQLKEENE
ncbi:MAG: Uncharacterised protein [Acidimicrobiales bacterium AG-410-I20]|nr:MAG: Uncharacterised protein [Acidimicrobiales bacterium AG-410-I20]